MTFLDDNAAREDAVRNTKENIIVEAAAGTGKTTLLINRLLFLILNDGVAVDALVALTFTKKAAEEMRARLEMRLRTIYEGGELPDFLIDARTKLGDEFLERCTHALNNLPRAHIGTIHGFAGHLLRLFPVQAHVDPSFREDNGVLFSHYFEETWGAWVKEIWSDTNAAGPWKGLLSVFQVEDLKEWAKAMASPYFNTEQALQKVDLDPSVKAALEQLKTISVPEKVRPSKALAALPLIRSLFETYLSKKSWVFDVEETRQFLAGAKPVSWMAEQADLYDRLRQQAADLLLVNDALCADLLQALDPFVKRFQSVLRKKGVVTFDGLLVFARNILRDRPDVRRLVKKQFAAFLIDEFQDTDPLQGEILFYLAESDETTANDWRQVRLAPGRLFIVGDPKQSIYRFRGADMEAYAEFERRLLEQGAKKLYLQKNFRSAPGLLSFVNQVMAGAMVEEPSVQPRYQPLLLGRADQAVGAIGARVFQSEGRSMSPVRRVAEAEEIAGWIEKHVGDSLRYADIALLFRTATPFDEYTQALRNHGIPFIVDGGKTFYSRPEAGMLINILSVLVNPGNAISFAGVLRSPLGGLSDEELFSLKRASPLFTFETDPVLAKEKLAPLYAALRQLRVKKDILPMPEFLRLLYETLHLRYLCAMARHAEQALANLDKLEDMCTDWSTGVNLTLSDLLLRLKEQKADDNKEGESPLSDDHYDAVRLMTVHKAKGLEFPVVFLPNLASKPNNRENERDWRRDWAHNRVGLRQTGTFMNAAMFLLKDRQNRHRVAEEMRVFYVALTRAKNSLYYFGSNQKMPYMKALDKVGFLPNDGVAASIGSGDTEIFVTWLKETGAFQNVRQDPEKFLSKKERSRLIAEFQKRVKERDEATRRPAFHSPTSLMKEEEKGFERDAETNQPFAPALVGTLCHAVLQSWNFNREDKNRAGLLKDALEKESRLLDLPTNTPAAKAVVHEAQTILSAFFISDAYRKLCGVRFVGREIPFVLPGGTLGQGIPLRGVIDLVYEDEGSLVIVDYKSNRVSAETLSTVSSSYAIQGAVYKKAIEDTLKRPAHFDILFLRTGDIIRI